MLPLQRPVHIAGSILLCLSACSSPGDAGKSLLRGSGRAALEARMAVADTRFLHGDTEAALEDYESIHADASRVRSRDVASESAAQVASSLARTGRLDEIGPWAERAAEAAHSTPEIRSRALLAEGLLAAARGDDLSARGHLIELHNHCRHHGLDRRAVEAAAHVARVSHGQERIDWIARAARASARLGDPALQCELELELALFLGDARREGEALETFERACRTAETEGAPEALRYRARWAHARGLSALGRCAEARRELDEVAATVQGLYVRRPSRDRAAVLGLVVGELGHIDAREGHVEQARARFVSALRKLTEAGAAPRLERHRARITAALADLDPLATSN